MTCEELEKDEDFFRGLRRGEFCLVLGAGFSYGLKNSADENALPNQKIAYELCKDIPLAGKFIEITNQLFEENVTDYKAAANIWNEKFNDGDQKADLEDLFKALFTLDIEFFKREKFALYKNILIPEWSHIFTLNFDDVIEAIVELCGRSDFKTLYYPNHTNVDLKERSTPIVHPHGYIKGTPPSKLVLSDETYNEIRGKEHDLYGILFSEINQNRKKLLLLGTRFYEPVINQKIFSQLKGKNLCIYHFDLDNANLRTMPAIKNSDYHFIKLTTEDFLRFLQKHRSRIEQIEVAGAELINDVFKDKVKRKGDKAGFTAEDFYLAKREDDCQWYGISQAWDVERDVYKTIKNKVVTSLNEYRSANISAKIWGRGGSGKSTLLRRLGWDLSEEDFAVLWIKDNEISRFYETGLRQIKEKYAHKKFLVLIEDLYRIKEQPGIKEIINEIYCIKNIRVVVGDREEDDDFYKQYIDDPVRNKIELNDNDNRKIIDRIIEIVKRWKGLADELLDNEFDYKSSLYNILFVFGRTAEKKGQSSDAIFKISGLIGHFQTLIESDLKLIGKHYPGLAQMLYYWASIYQERKVFLSYDLFFTLSDKFQNSQIISSKHALISNHVKKLLDRYIHKKKGFFESVGEIEFITFNQDIIAEDGLSKAKLKDWHPFDNSMKLRLLSYIIDSGDHFSSDNFLRFCLLSIPDDMFKLTEKRKYIERLLEQNNYGFYLSTVLESDIYDRIEKRNISCRVLSQHNFWKLQPDTVCLSLFYSQDITKTDEILSQDKFWELDPKIVSLSLNLSQNREKAEEILLQDKFWKLPKKIVNWGLKLSKNREKAEEILSQDKFWELPHDTVCWALDSSQNRDKANEILSQAKFWELNPKIVSLSLNLSQNRKKANEILSRDKFWKLPNSIVSTALNLSQNRSKANEILSQHNFLELPRDIVSVALNLSKNRSKADEILSQDKFWELPGGIVSVALNLSQNREKADEILSQDKFLEFPNSIVSTALNLSQNKEKADEILSQEKFWELPLDIVCWALNLSKNRDKAEEILSQEKFWELPGEIVSWALNLSQNREKAEEILSQEKFWELPQNIVCWALNLSQNREKAEEILSQDKFWKLPTVIVCRALNLSQNREKAYAILSQDEFWKLPTDIVCRALNLSQNKEKADVILLQDNFWELPYPIVCIALKLSQDSTKADMILTQDNLWELPHQIVCIALKLSQDTAKADAILSQDNFWELPHQIVSLAYMYSKNDLLKREIAEFILKQPDLKKKWSLTYQALYYVSSFDVIPSYARKIVKQIINDKYNRVNKDKGKFFYFTNLMKIPFFAISEWVQSSFNIIANWQKQNRTLVLNTILAWHKRPNVIKDMCENILRNWERELKQKIDKVNSTISYGDHVRLSLGHPELKELARKTAFMMRKKADIPEHVMTAVDAIIDRDEFPVWTEDNEQNEDS